MRGRPVGYTGRPVSFWGRCTRPPDKRCLQSPRRNRLSANVVAFPPTREDRTITAIPTPLFYSPGDRYVRVNIEDESAILLGLYPGAVVIFLENFRQDGGLHLITLGGVDRVARLARHGHMVHVIHEGTFLPAPQVEVYGAMAELYPLGLAGPRTITYREDRARLMAPRHPERGMELRLVSGSSL